jgi:hypothetical protein
MRKFLIIFCAILAYLALSSKSCGSDEMDETANNNAEVAKTRVNIKDEFESDDLSRKSLKGFEAKAKQDLVDFSDYLNICSNQLLDSSFRTQARTMILDMFISDSIKISNRILDKKELKNIPLIEFLDLDPASNYISMYFMLDSISITEPLREMNDLSYKGRLSFSRHVKAFSDSDTLISSPARMEAEIIVSKVAKPFGTDTLTVWSVFLGEIR